MNVAISWKLPEGGWSEMQNYVLFPVDGSLGALKEEVRRIQRAARAVLVLPNDDALYLYHNKPSGCTLREVR